MKAPGITDSSKNYRLAIFDFDGTLADSFGFCVEMVNSLADKHGFRKVDHKQIESLRRLHAREIMRQLDLPMWRLPLIAADFISRMKRNSAQIQLFPGVGETLAFLKRQGLTLAIMSSNSRENIETILGPELMGNIDSVDCRMSIFSKGERISKLLRGALIPGSEAIYVGDQLIDLEAAHSAGTAFGAVSWGYGSVEPMIAGGAEEVFREFDDIRRIG